jgi:glycosyltransferase involved in cell wall biosynthesis
MKDFLNMNSQFSTHQKALSVLHLDWKTLPDFRGRDATHTSNLINELEGLEITQGYLFTGDGDDTQNIHLKKVKENNGKIDCWAIKNTFNSINPPRKDIASLQVENSVFKVVKEFRPQLIHIHSMIGFSASTIERLKAIFNIPIIITIRDYWYICPMIHLINSRGENCIDNAHGDGCALCYKARTIKHINNSPFLFWAGEFQARKAAWIRAINLTDMVIAVSPFLKDFYIRNGVDPDKIIVLSGGILPQAVGTRKPKKRDNIFRIALLGNATSIWGINLILDILAIWHDQNVRIKVWGNCSEQRIMQRVKKFDDARLQFQGPYEREDITDMLSNIDIGIVPSDWADPEPQAVFDFLSHGIPVVASRIGGIPNFVKNEINGILFKPNDANALVGCLLQLKNSPSKIEKLRKNIEYPKTFMEQAIEIKSIYKVIVNNNKNNKRNSIELGGGESPAKKRQGFINTDFRTTSQVDLVADVKIIPFKHSSIDEIYAANLVEHFPRNEIQKVLLEWWRALKHGGWADIMVPDLEGTLDNWRQMPFDRVLDSLYGAQKFKGDYHYNGLTPRTIKKLLLNSGFKNFPIFQRGNILDVPRIFVRAQKKIKVRIFPIGDTSVGSSRLRVHNIYPHLVGKGYDIQLYGDPADCDVAIFQKVFDKKTVERCKSVTILDIDDNNFEFTNDSIACRNISRTVSAIVTSTPELATIAQKYSNNFVDIIPTSIDIYSNHSTLPNGFKNKVTLAGWIGNPENLHYLDVITDVIRNIGLKLRVITRAADVDCKWWNKNKDIIELYDWTLESSDKLLMECDIGIAPLKNDSWSNAKSGVKILKYWALGIPAVCSPTPEYIRIESELKVRCVAHDNKEWIQLLNSNSKERSQQVQHAQKGLKKYLAPSIAEQWSCLIDRLMFDYYKNKGRNTSHENLNSNQEKGAEGFYLSPNQQ